MTSFLAGQKPLLLARLLLASVVASPATAAALPVIEPVECYFSSVGNHHLKAFVLNEGCVRSRRRIAPAT